MSNLVAEILLRFVKPSIAALLGLVIYLVAIGAWRARLGRAGAAVLAVAPRPSSCSSRKGRSSRPSLALVHALRSVC